MTCLLQSNLQLWIPHLGEVYHSPSIPAGRFCKAHSPKILVWAFGTQVLILTHPNLNAGLAKHQGASAKFWPQTTQFWQLPALCTHKSTYAQRSGASWVMAPTNWEIRENWCTPKKKKSLGWQTVESSFQAPTATNVGKTVCICVSVSPTYF